MFTNATWERTQDPQRRAEIAESRKRVMAKRYLATRGFYRPDIATLPTDVLVILARTEKMAGSYSWEKIAR